MRKNWVKSDKSNNMSGNHERKSISIPQKKEKDFGEAASIISNVYPSRLTNRTIQTVRQTRLQMLKRERAWSQILSFDELSQTKAGNGLCSTGLSFPGNRISWKFPKSKKNTRGNLHDKPGTSKEKRKTLNLKEKHGRYNRKFNTGDSLRHRFSGYYSSQYG